MKVYLSIVNAAIAAFFISCGSSSNEPCDYTTTQFQATIVDIDVVYRQNPKDTVYDIILQFDKSSLSKKRQSMNKLRGVDVNYDQMIKNSYQIGNILTGTVSERTAGNCEKLYISFNQSIRE